MKLTVYWLTTELRNSGTDTEVFVTEAEVFERFKSLIEERLQEPSIRHETDPERREAIDYIKAALATDRIMDAWSAFRDHAIIDEDDYVSWGEQEIEISAHGGLVTPATPQAHTLEWYQQDLRVREFYPVDGDFFLISNAEDRLIAKTFRPEDTRRVVDSLRACRFIDPDLSNAHVIAAASDLLAALIRLRHIAVWDEDFDEADRREFDEATQAADLAIAKAQGGAQ